MKPRVITIDDLQLIICETFGDHSAFHLPENGGRFKLSFGRGFLNDLQNFARQYNENRKVAPLAMIISTRIGTRGTYLLQQRGIDHLAMVAHARSEAGAYKKALQDEDSVYLLQLPCNTSLGAPFAREWACRIFPMALLKFMEDYPLVRAYLEYIWIMDDDGRHVRDCENDNKEAKESSLEETAIAFRDQMSLDSSIQAIGTSPARNTRWTKSHKEKRRADLTNTNRLEQFFLVRTSAFLVASFLPLRFATLDPSIWTDIFKLKEIKKWKEIFFIGEDFGFSKDLSRTFKSGVKLATFKYFIEKNGRAKSTVGATGRRKVLTAGEKVKKGIALLQTLPTYLDN